MRFAFFKYERSGGGRLQRLNVIQPGHQLVGDLLRQRLDGLTCVEDMPALRLLRDHLLVAGCDLLMVGQLTRIKPVPFDRRVARGSRGDGEQGRKGSTRPIRATARLLISLFPYLLVALS